MHDACRSFDERHGTGARRVLADAPTVPEGGLAEREDSAWARLAAAEQRDAIAEERDVAALARDAAADARDRWMAEHDAAAQQDDDLPRSGSERIVRAAGARKRAMLRRAHAAEYRVLAARDRTLAARDREEAARERRRALSDLEALAREVQPQPRRAPRLAATKRARAARSPTPAGPPQGAGVEVDARQPGVGRPGVRTLLRLNAAIHILAAGSRAPRPPTS